MKTKRLVGILSGLTPTPITPLNPFSAFASPRVCYSMMKVNPAYAGGCMNTREVTTPSNQHLIGFPAGFPSKINQSAILPGWGALTVADWRDQSGNGFNVTATSRPNLTLSAVNDGTGNPTPAPDYVTKSMFLGASAPALNFGGTHNFTVFMVFDTLGFVPAGNDYTVSRPGAFNAGSSGPNVALSVGTSSILFAQSAPYASDGTDPSFPTNVTTIGDKRETIVDLRPITGVPGARYVNVWYNFKADLVSGGCDDRIAFQNRYHQMAEIVAGQLTIGANGARNTAFNGRIMEVVIFNDDSKQLSDVECQRIGMDIKARWNTPATNYDPSTDAYTPSFGGRMRVGDWAAASKQLYPPNTLSSNSAVETWDVSITEGVGAPWPTEGMIWPFSNGFTIRDGSEPPERAVGNSIEVRQKLYVNGVFVRDILFGGSAGYKSIPDRSHVLSDAAMGLAWPANQTYQIVTLLKRTGRRPGQYRTGQSYGQNFTTEAAAIAAFNNPSTIVASGTGDDVYSYGPSAALALGWNGSVAVSLFLGNSIGQGDYAGRSWYTYAMTTEFGGEETPYLNLAVQGTSPRNSSYLTQGLFQWKDALIQLMKTPNQGRDFFTSISTEHCVNSASPTGIPSQLLSIMQYHFKFIFYRYRPFKMNWFTPTPKYEADPWWFFTNTNAVRPVAPNIGQAINGYQAQGRNGDRFFVTDWFKTNGYALFNLTGIIDTQQDWTQGGSSVAWRTAPGGTLTAQMLPGANSFTSNTLPSIGDRAIINAGNTGTQEYAGSVQSYTGAGPYLVQLTGGSATFTHEIGETVIYGTPYDQTHPAPRTQAWIMAATRVATAKQANFFGY